MNVASTSPSPSRKGKEREVEPLPILPVPDSEEISKKTEDLNQKLDVQTTKLAVHSALVSSFKDSLTCQICVDLMHKPFTLAPCGHMACYSCLVGWFKSNVAEDEFGPQSVHRKKTCPHCRSAIRDRPIESFTIKEMVNSLVNSGLLEDTSGTAAAINASAIPIDPWAGVFPKHSVWENNLDGPPFPLFGEAEGEDDVFEEGDMGMYDEEDDVYRCRGCMNEVVDGICAVCEREYRPSWAEALFGEFFGGHGHPLLGGVDDLDSDDEEEDFQEGYEESFIDDDEEVSEAPGSDIDPIPPPALFEDDGDDEDVIEVDSPAVARQRTRQPAIVISSDEEGDEPTDADTHGDYARSWNEDDEDVDYHDAHSNPEYLDNHGYQSGGEHYNDDDGSDYDDDHHGFYGYL